MKYFGAGQLTEFVQKDIDQIAYLADQLAQIPNVLVESEHPLSILCFRYDNPDQSTEENEEVNIQAIRELEADGRIFITGTKLKGQTYLRVYYGNPERTKDDVNTMVGVIKSTLSKIFEN